MHRVIHFAAVYDTLHAVFGTLHAVYHKLHEVHDTLRMYYRVMWCMIQLQLSLVYGTMMPGVLSRVNIG